MGTLVKLVLTNVKSKKEKENYWREICTESKNALKPVRGKKIKNKKYVMAYQVLCKMINFIEIDYEYSKSCVSFNPRLKIDCECDWECRENGEDEEGESYYDDDKTMILDGEIDFSLTSYAGIKSEESFKVIDFSRFYVMLYIKVYNNIYITFNGKIILNGLFISPSPLPPLLDVTDVQQTLQSRRRNCWHH